MNLYMKQTLIDDIINYLAGEPEGLSATILRARLKPRVSQPTLWRHLDYLRGRGQVVAEGRGRATRYHAASRHDIGALRSRRFHESVASHLRREPALVEHARVRLAFLREINPHGRVYHDRWQELIDGPLPRLLRTLTEDSEAADALRKESPFTVLVRPTERRRILAELRAA